MLRRDTSPPAPHGEQTSQPPSGSETLTYTDVPSSESDQATSPTGTEDSSSNKSDPDSFGVGGDPDIGAQVAKADRPEIRRALDRIDETDVTATMLVAGLGGGTGSGVGSLLLDELSSIYETAVYALGVLPAGNEAPIRALTAARGLQTFVPRTDSMFLVDNEAWRQDNSAIADSYSSINKMTVERLLSVFGTGERAGTPLSEMRIDPADITRTLNLGGVSTIGHSTMTLDTQSVGLLRRVLSLLRRSSSSVSTPVDATQIKTLISQAVQSKMTLPCEITSADRVLLILTGPPDTISRKGFETGRYLLEEKTETVEVLAGDEPVQKSTELTATVVLSNVTSVPRIDNLQQRAVAAQSDPDADTSVASSAHSQQSYTLSVTDQNSTQSHRDTQRTEFDFGEATTDLDTTDSPDNET
ncbi:Tubulin/FtsZ GTPase [Halorubrum coriense DSM 10284]|uniref:Tubulin-like protein CetZ n=1 Tax=Halorubrum coriense DSM 10284 TaxID=1227466 RepID=M0ESL7_9EURY|nr:Tubulin/FtsZ GTPase [Halorubrum coriense DSM 10284]